MYSDVGADFLSFKIFIVYKSLAMAECMASNGLREVTKLSQNSLTIMEELNENDVKLKWFDGEKVLQLVTKAGTHGNFVQIVPVGLIP